MFVSKIVRVISSVGWWGIFIWVFFVVLVEGNLFFDGRMVVF